MAKYSITLKHHSYIDVYHIEAEDLEKAKEIAINPEARRICGKRVFIGWLDENKEVSILDATKVIKEGD